MTSEKRLIAQRAYNKKWRAAHPEKARAKQREYWKRIKANPEKAKAAYEYCKKWRAENLEKAKLSCKNYRAKHPEKGKVIHLRTNYGMTLEEWNIMYAFQRGRCAICEEHVERLNVDHDHQNGRIRALLCRHCNSALGYVRESERIALSLADYIRNVC
jgi:hypothetical protein